MVDMHILRTMNMNLLFADFLSLDFFYPDKPKTTTTINSAQVLKFFLIVVVFSVLDHDVKYC